jgi:hypothetical protein
MPVETIRILTGGDIPDESSQAPDYEGFWFKTLTSKLKNSEIHLTLPGWSTRGFLKKNFGG